MQLTITEHAASEFASASCQTCHMPKVTPKAGAAGAPHVDHSFAASRDQAMLAKAVRIRAERPSPTRVTLTLSPGEVGHAFPTGDLFRRIVLVVATSKEPSDRDAAGTSSRRVLMRRFRDVTTGQGTTIRVPSVDDRIGAPGKPRARTFEFAIAPEASHRTAEWRIEYERAEMPATSSTLAEIEERIVVARGTLAAPSFDAKHEHDDDENVRMTEKTR